ncbi:MAG: phosphoribosylformylglycinamidine synthase subunit PurS [Candidatus Omnitrophota bacterium]
MLYKIEVRDKSGIFDAVGEGVKGDIIDFGINSVRDVRFVQVYTIIGELAEEDVKRICGELLADKICQDYSIKKGDVAEIGDVSTFLGLKAGKVETSPFSAISIVEVAYNPGVMDPVEESTLKGIRDLGIEGVRSVKAARKYIIKGKLSAGQLKTICEKLLYNKLIQHIVKEEKKGDVSTFPRPCCPKSRSVPLFRNFPGFISRIR